MWPLDPAVTYLNHGGSGVTPRAVMAAQARWRNRIERNPAHFMIRELPAALRAAADTLARYLNARGSDLVFVENATTGMNAVLRSIELGPGDEILTTSLAYGAVTKAIGYAAARAGASVITVEIPLPVADLRFMTDAIATRLSTRTRLVVCDHIASRSALVMPVTAIAALAHQAGARLLVDGAHAPGQLPLDIPALGADFYVGNCHKWLLAPRSCGFLWALPAAQEMVHPAVISFGLGAGFTAEFDWTGTRDPTAYLCVPAGIAFHQRLGGSALIARNHALAVEAARMLIGTWATETAGPVEAFAAMAAVRIPLAPPASEERAVALRESLARDHRIEAEVFAQPDALWMRVAAQAYNELADYERLAEIFKPGS